MRFVARIWTGLLLLPMLPVAARAQQPPLPPPAAQSPSPMVEESRLHERLAPRELGGTKRFFTGPLEKVVELWIPDGAKGDERFDLVIHFHGAASVAQQSVAALDRRTVSVTLNLGAGSGVYARPFADSAAFDSLLANIAREVAVVAGRPTLPGTITLAGWSAGYGAIRAILREPRQFARVNNVMLLDGIHTSYVPDGKVVATGGVLDTANLGVFAEFARAAVRGEKRMLVTHSEIFPGTFASTTECTNWLVRALGLKRSAILQWGARGMQQTSVARAGGFELQGYAGNSAPDHVDHLHALPELLVRLIRDVPMR